MAELPNFRFDLERAKGWSGEGGTAVQHTVDNFPVYTSFAAVSMRLQLGALRELHWHAVSAEWAYAVTGACRVTCGQRHKCSTRRIVGRINQVARENFAADCRDVCQATQAPAEKAHHDGDAGAIWS
ncbi:MAG: cupin domain-containing protein [Vulcanimicrobiaceae bacterium]